MANSKEFIAKRRALIKNGEGSISHMYLDTVGKVTIGVGNMLPDVESAEALPFVTQKHMEPASKNEIRREFELVQQQKTGLIASSYRQYTKLQLTDEYIDQLLDKRIDEFETGLQKDFDNYESYPDAVRLGLMDMAFNLGNSGLIRKFPTFTLAAKEEKWDVCATECKRRGISDERNRETRELFESVS